MSQILEKAKNFVAENKYAQFALILLLGVAIGAIFYPTKRIEERERIKYEEQLSIVNKKRSEETSKAQEEIAKKTEEFRSYQKESELKVYSLTTQVRDLKSKQKTAYYKLIKPDGTIEIKKFSESEVTESTKVITEIQTEFKEKVTQIEKKWSEIHERRVTEIKKEFDSKEETYKKTIVELEKSKVVEINKKNFGLEAGMLLNKSYYAHATADLFGPIFIGLHGEVNTTNTGANTMGAGIGLRF